MKALMLAILVILVSGCAEKVAMERCHKTYNINGGQTTVCHDFSSCSAVRWKDGCPCPNGSIC
jgi:hypothetical protein